MQLSGAPSKIVEGFGVNGQKNVIPVPSQIPVTPGAASFNDGFPPLTMTPVSSGGVPPSGMDMNGILYAATIIDNWMSAGASFPFDSVFAAVVGGYPKGARVLNAAGTGFWINTADNNSTNPDTGAAPTGWIPDRAVASVYASAPQSLGPGTVKVVFNTVEFDEFGLWNAGSSHFAALWAGKYRFTGSVYLQNGGAPQNVGVSVYQNGTLVKQCSLSPAVTDQPLSYSFDAIIACAEGDYLDVYLSAPTNAVEAGIGSGSNQPYVYGQLEYLGS